MTPDEIVDLDNRKLRQALYSLERSKWVEGSGGVGDRQQWLLRKHARSWSVAFLFPVISS